SRRSRRRAGTPTSRRAAARRPPASAAARHLHAARDVLLLAPSLLQQEPADLAVLQGDADDDVVPFVLERQLPQVDLVALLLQLAQVGRLIALGQSGANLF